MFDYFNVIVEDDHFAGTGIELIESVVFVLVLFDDHLCDDVNRWHDGSRRCDDRLRARRCIHSGETVRRLRRLMSDLFLNEQTNENLTIVQ